MTPKFVLNLVVLQKSYMTFFNLVFLPDYNTVKQVNRKSKKISSRNTKFDNHFDYEFYKDELLIKLKYNQVPTNK